MAGVLNRVGLARRREVGQAFVCSGGVVVWWGKVDFCGRTENIWTWQPNPPWWDIIISPALHEPGWAHGGDDTSENGPWGK